MAPRVQIRGVEQYTCKQTDFYSINQFDGNNLQGYIQTAVYARDQQGGFCNTVLPYIGEIASAVSQFGGPLMGIANIICDGVTYG